MNDIYDQFLLNEVYFGKTDSIIMIQDQLSRFRAKYIGTNNKPNNDPDLIKLNRLVEDSFGFGCFSLMVVYNPFPMATTIPVDYSFDATKKRNNYIVDQSSYRFKKEFDYTCIITMSNTLIFNDLFTDDEVMACLLHELGMNFYSCMHDFNGILSNLYNATIIANSVAQIVKDFKSAKALFDMAGANFDKDIMDTATRQMLDKAQEGDDPEILAMIRDEIVADNLNDPKNKAMKMANKIAFALPNIIDAIYVGFKTSKPYLNLKSKVKNTAENHEPTKQLMFDFKDKLQYAAGVAYKNVPYAVTVIGKVKQSGVSVRSVVKALDVKQFIIPYRKVLSKAKNPLSYITLGVNYKVERAADNFPTMYGYGAAEISLYNKMKSKDAIKYVNGVIDKAPIIGIFMDTLLLPSKVLNNVFDSSPSGISKCYDQIKLLKAELAKENLDPKMRKVLEDDIKLCEYNLSQLVDISKGVKDPELCRHLYNKAMADMFDGMGIKDFILDDRNKFAKYDLNIDNKSKQSNNESY